MIVIFIGTHSQVNIVLDNLNGTASTGVDNGSKATRKQLQRTARGRVTGTTVQQGQGPEGQGPLAGQHPHSLPGAAVVVVVVVIVVVVVVTRVVVVVVPVAAGCPGSVGPVGVSGTGSGMPLL